MPATNNPANLFRHVSAGKPALFLNLPSGGHDGALTPAMRVHGLSIPEESLVASLLRDLSRGPHGGRYA